MDSLQAGIGEPEATDESQVRLLYQELLTKRGTRKTRVRWRT